MKNKNIKGIFMYRMLIIFVMILGASTIGALFKYMGFSETNIVLVYLLAIVLITWAATGFITGIIASIIATFTFNYLFTEPNFSFSVNNPSYMITFVIMIITAFITSTLTSKMKNNALEAREKEAEATALYSLNTRLTCASDINDMAQISASAVSLCFDCEAQCLCFYKSNKYEKVREKIENLETLYDQGEKFWDWPIYGNESSLGVIRIPADKAKAMKEDQMSLLKVMIESIALAMDRWQASQKQMEADAEIVQERYRTNLLRSISHDLRTPLSGIIGTSEMLLDMIDQTDDKYEMIKGIYNEADWLHGLMENILSLTKLDDGRLTIEKESEAVEEIVGGAVAHISKRFPEYEIKVKVPEELLLVPMDAKLIEQVLMNLLDNAVKHTPKGKEIGVSVTENKKENKAIFTVRDQGNGISSDEVPLVFKPFYTSRGKLADAHRGTGLGLPICEAIVKAHGGQIEARNCQQGNGAEFIFTLPMEEKKNDEFRYKYSDSRR
ncbi:sensor histidine kinase [Aminipila sp.]|uniref:sensor histidine kinase n=1 Tax=Aminipila sp. TaxID=2060095 RepID=UPI0028A2DB0A|nr:ATP-binding protein [Aminipila sp.]